MTLALSGAAAAVLTPQAQQDGTVDLVLSTIPTASSLSLQAVETEAGYTPSSHTTTVTFTYAGGTSGAFPGIPNERIITPAIVPAAATTGLASGYATPWKAPLGVGSHLDYVIDFSTLLGSDTIAAIEQLTENAAAGLLGVTIDDTSGYPPIVDSNGSQRVRLFLGCTPPDGSTGLNGPGIYAGITCRIRTDGSNGQPVRRYEVTGAVPVRAL